MIWSWRSLSVRCVSWGFLLAGFAPATASAQTGVELGFHALRTEAHADFLGAGAQLLFRPGGRARFVATMTPGALDGDFAMRGELLGQFLLNPRSRKTGIYTGGGLAAVTASATEGYVVLMIGIESNPGGRSGWMLEAGIGGGVRVLAGYRWRKLKR
ncbi:MAG: hypothetical protein ABI679_07750 [Gemmatimonadota bacterium]